MLFLASFALGSALSLILMFSINFISKQKKRSARLGWDNSTGDELHLKTAGISGDMAPLFEQLPLEGASVTVGAGDGSYLISKKGKHLKAAIRDWLHRGAVVDYILIRPDDATLSEFRKFSDQLSRKRTVNSPRFSLEIFSDDCKNEGQVIAAEFENHHPTLVRTLDGEAMWLEGLHPHDSMYAYNVRFIPPSAAKKSREASETIANYREKVEELRASCRQVQ